MRIEKKIRAAQGPPERMRRAEQMAQLRAMGRSELIQPILYRLGIIASGCSSSDWCKLIFRSARWLKSFGCSWASWPFARRPAAIFHATSLSRNRLSPDSHAAATGSAPDQHAVDSVGDEENRHLCDLCRRAELMSRLIG